MKRLKLFEWLILLTIALGAPPLSAAFWQWSTTAGNNSSADPSINWAEGMSPSSVNDSARAMMSVLAGWRNDVSGRLVTAGTATAYTLTSSQNFQSAADANGAEISFTMHLTNGAAPTLAVDSSGAAPLIADADGSQHAVPAGSMIAGAVYTATFYSSGPSWRLKNFYNNVFNVPLGGIIWSTLTTAPNSNFLAPSGQCISTTIYAEYWVALGSPASGACPGGQFALIDMRGRVPAALDTLNASAASRLTAGATGCGTAMTSVGATCANGVEGLPLTLAQLPTGITSSGTNTISVTGFTNGNVFSTTLAGSGFAYQAGTTNFNLSSGVGISSGNNLIGVTSNNTSGTATPRVQPTIGLIPYLRVL